MITTSRVSAIRLAGSFYVFEDLECRKPPRRAHDPAARMRGRSTHIEVLDRRAELSVAGHRTQEEKLFERKLALKNVSFAQPELPVKVERREHLLVDNDVLDVRRVLGDGVDHVVAEGFALVVPV